MNIECIDRIEYSKIFCYNFIIFNTVEFNILNSSKCESIEFLLFHEGNKRLGLIAGYKDNILFSPFSAPFTFFSVQDSNIKINYLIDACLLLEEYSKNKNLEAIKIILPPCFYEENLISKFVFCLFSHNYTLKIDLNHVFYIKNYIKYINGNMCKDIRYKINMAIKNNLIFVEGKTENELRQAYDVILMNKETKGRTHAMTLEQILKMNEIFEIDFFIVKHDEKPVSSAIVYKHSKKIVQVIYWGDIPEFSKYYPMNFLAYNIFRVYQEKCAEIVDLGTSMLGCNPNIGLSNFKESIGATASVKLTFFKNLSNY